MARSVRARGPCSRPTSAGRPSWSGSRSSSWAGAPTELLAESRAALAAYLGAAADDLVYFPNPTTAINMVARNVARLAGRR